MSITIEWIRTTLCTLFALTGLFIAASENISPVYLFLGFLGCEGMAYLLYPKHLTDEFDDLDEEEIDE